MHMLDNQKIPIMNKFTTLAFLIFLLACSVSDESPGKNEKDITTIHIEDILSPKTNVVAYSDLLDSCSYVSLETNSYNLIGDLVDLANQKMRVSSNHILFDSFIFRKNGEYVGSIGRVGNGPGEYSAIRSIALDEQKDRVFLYDHWKHNILCYNFKGNYFSTIKDTLNTYQTDMFYMGDDKLLLYSANLHPILKIQQYDLTSGNTENLMEIDFSHTVANKNFSFPPYPNWQIYSLEDSVHFMIEFPANVSESDYIYVINESSAIPKYKFELGELKSEKLFSSKNDLSQKAFVRVLGESGQYLFFRCFTIKGKDITVANCIFDKETATLKRLSLGDKSKISNLLLARMVIKNDSIFSYIYPYELDEVSINQLNTLLYGNDEKKKHELISLSKTINEEDNPILLVSKLK